MHRKLFTAAAIMIFITTLPVSGQDYLSLPSLRDSGLDGLKVLTERVFNSESLFGYMNGGAELYLEYGFNTLLVSEAEWEGETFKVEIFDMNGLEEAFGIYSVSVFRCDETGVVTQLSCLSQYQLQICIGDTYINVINNSGSGAGAASAVRIGRWLADRLTGDTFDSAMFIPGEDPGSYDRLVLVRGSLGLFNGASEWEQLLSELSGYSALIATGDSGTRILLRADNPESEKAVNLFCESDRIPEDVEVSQPGSGKAIVVKRRIF